MSLLPVAISAPVCRIWSRSSQQCLAILRGHAGRGIWRCLLSPQHAITAGADGSIKMWRLADHVPGLRASAEPAAQGTAEDSLMAQALALYGSTFQAYLASAQLCSILAGVPCCHRMRCWQVDGVCAHAFWVQRPRVTGSDLLWG